MDSRLADSRPERLRRGRHGRDHLVDGVDRKPEGAIMTATEIIAILTTAFRALPEEGRRNLRWHLKQGTPVLCGPGSDDAYQLDGIY